MHRQEEVINVLWLFDHIKEGCFIIAIIGILVCSEKPLNTIIVQTAVN